MIHACTIIARNYLPFARVLAESFRKHHPDACFTALVVDDVSGGMDASGEPFKIMRISDIGLPPGDEYRMPLLYDVTEFSTAVKPWLLRRLLDAGADAVLYLDPDILVCGSLDDLGELARKHDIVLTPHTTRPIPRDNRKVSETDILGAGAFNLGFIGVGKGGGAFLDWWQERLRRECLIHLEAMRFVDQRWIDLVPSYFPHWILRDPGCNVAYWNLYYRRVKRVEKGYEANGTPVRFFHFSGYNPDKPHLLSKHQGNLPRVLLSNEPDLMRACSEYGALLKAADYDRIPETPYAYDRMPNGICVDRFMRRLYWCAVERWEKGERAEPPNPFRKGECDAFVEWLNEPALHLDGWDVSSYLHIIYQQHENLRAMFPDLKGDDGGGFYDWIVLMGARQLKLHKKFLPRSKKMAVRKTNDTKKSDSTPPVLKRGVNLIGYLNAEIGMGEGGRLLAAGLKASGVPHSTVSYRQGAYRQLHAFRDDGMAAACHDIHLMNINADQIALVLASMPSELVEQRYIIGAWYWEVEMFPMAMRMGFNKVDEIWTATSFMAESFRKCSPKPVYAFTQTVVKPCYSSGIKRSDLGLPDRFLFLFCFDFLSVMGRKNPLGLIEAFSRAFKPDEGPVLVVKSINGDKRPLDLEKLRLAAARHPHVVLREDYLTHEQKNALMGACDCYVSLHSSEGFGLTMAEAMALGKPVIGTAYSGNMEFMNEGNSYLCPFDLKPIGQENDPYPPEARWAYPRLDDAADLMRRVVKFPEEAHERGRRAQNEVLEKHSPQKTAEFIRHRVKAIHQFRS